MPFTNAHKPHVVVAGGTGKIGVGITKHLCGSGFNVSVLTRSPSRQLQFNNTECLYICSCDVSDSQALSTCLDHLSSLGDISAFVNATSYRPSVHCQTPSTATWSDSILQNSLLLYVPVSLFSQYFLNHDIPGSVVCLSSIYGLVAPTFSIYSNTLYTTEPDYAYNKSAAIGYMRYLAALYAPNGLRYNTICPGGIASAQEDAFIDNYNSVVPARRMGLPSDVAPLVSFLCSPQSAYITGACIPVDGGWTCQ
jgi:NAD(P)-dependent dehydrogenase (short-subunit alcohol dehydrogenase family)